MTHQSHMLLALQLAEKGRLTVSPNPMVGCVIVQQDHIVGQGYHQRAGEAHAEIHALQQAGQSAKGATAYVTLEPCCHYGRTPPCTQALIQSGIKKIYVACLDPNPLVAGKGVEALRQAGMTVEVGLEEQAAKNLNKIFFHYIQHKRPFVIAKWAMSIDGKTMTHPNDDRAISGEEAKQFSHQMRQQVDAILIGAKTAVLDNPLLTVRLNQTSSKHPIRIVLSGKGNLPEDLNLFSTAMPARTIIFTTDDVDPTWQVRMLKNNIEVVVSKKNSSGKIDLNEMLLELGKRDITSLLIEGGMQTHENFFAANLVNEIQVYIAPVIIGNLSTKKKLMNLSCKQIGNDYLVTAEQIGETHV